MNTLSIIVLLIFLAFIILGYNRGLIRTIFKTIIAIVSIVVAYVLTPMLSTAVCENSNIDNYFEEKIYETVKETVGEAVNNKVEGYIGNIPEVGNTAITDITLKVEPTKEQQDKFIDMMDIPSFAKDMLKSNNNEATRKALGVNDFYHFISTYIAKMIVNALAFMCLFVIIYIVANILMIAAGILSNLPIINGANRLGGAVIGFFEAVILTWAFFLIVAVLINTDFGKMIYSQIEDSQILQALYDGNLFLPLVTKM